MYATARGVAGEVLAARFLRDKGYRIMSSNYRSRFGEIDIIAQNGQYIVFVEVKARSENSFYMPREAVTEDKQEKILEFLTDYVNEKGYPPSVREIFKPGRAQTLADLERQAQAELARMGATRAKRFFGIKK